MRSGPRILFVGIPNSGKSTLFNRLTGAAANVGNYPGITVEAFEASLTLPSGATARATDLPGTYSLAARSPDEAVVVDALLGAKEYHPNPDVVVMIADAGRLAQSTYLLLQVLELDVPVVVALNLIDEARAKGETFDAARMAQVFDVPVIPTSGRSGEGLEPLLEHVEMVLDSQDLGRSSVAIDWPLSIETTTEDIAAQLPARLTRDGAASPRRREGIARWLMLSVADDPEALRDGDDLPWDALAPCCNMSDVDLQSMLIEPRYRWFDQYESSMRADGSVAAESKVSQQLDRWLLNPITGTVAFFSVMGLIFMALFNWSDPLIGLIENAFMGVGDLVSAAFTAAGFAPGSWAWLLHDFVIDGLIGGVGAVVVFVPQIAILSLLLAVLEDSGYLARAALLMDRILRLAGLPGQAFVPLLSGFACAVPAIQATRTLPRFRDRLLTMMVLPLTSCSARLPVYTLLIASLFPVSIPGFFLPVQPLALFGMYLFSTVVTLVAAVVIGKLVLPDKATPVVLELPPWRLPTVAQILRNTGRRTWSFLREAGGVILVATVVLWGLLTFPRVDPATLVDESEVASLEAAGLSVDEVAKGRALEQTLGGQIGKTMEPIIRPLGYDWRIGVGIVGAFAAREVFVSTLGVVYGAGDDAEETTTLRQRMTEARWPDGEPVYTPLVGISLMVFFALAMQCLSTLAILRRESGGWRWPLVTVSYMSVLAWLAAFIVYQGGRLLGLG